MKITKQQIIEMIKSPQKTAILFYADWCDSCKGVMPLVENKQHQGHNFILINESPETEKLSEGFDIQFYPTIVILGQNTSEKIVGEKKVQKYLSKL
jgi:thiol-disulfide isomerase/thioredoxin